MSEEKRLTKVCGHTGCSISTGYVYEELTFGRGQLDDYGYWEIPCGPCARAWEDAHPGKLCWPFEHPEKGEGCRGSE